MGLANQKEMEAFADQLTACADSIHERLMKAITRKEVGRNEAQAIFQEEARLRQLANGLYLDAVNCVVVGLADPQKIILGVVDAAKDRIREIREVAKLINLIAGLISLALAASGGKPAPVLAALKELKKDIGA